LLQKQTSSRKLAARRGIIKGFKIVVKLQYFTPGKSEHRKATSTACYLRGEIISTQWDNWGSIASFGKINFQIPAIYFKLGASCSRIFCAYFLRFSALKHIDGARERSSGSQQDSSKAKYKDLNGNLS